MVDTETGEVVGSNNFQKHRLVMEKQQFIFLYKKILKAMVSLSENEIKVFIALSFDVDISSYTFRSDRKLADDIGKSLSIAPKTVFNCISVLNKQGLIVRDTKYTNLYRIHPDYGWRGEQKNRSKVLHLVLEQQKEHGANVEIDEDINGLYIITPNEDGSENARNKGGRPKS
jgi:hypothetical protein